MKYQRRPRALSLTLPNTKQPIFLFNGERYLLRNVSEEGIGLWVPQERAFGLTPKTKVSGDIVIDKAIHPVTLEVVHSTKGYVGLKIVSAANTLIKVLQNLLEPSHYACALLPALPTNVDSGFTQFNYTAGPVAGLNFWVGPSGDIRSLHVRVLGKWIARDQFSPPRTGVIADDPAPSISHEENLLMMHSTADQDFIQTAAQFLTSVPLPIPGALLWHFLESGEQVFLPAEFLRKVG